MKATFLILIFFISVSLFSQKKEFLKKIDSINQKKWDSVALNLDSLANPRLIGLRNNLKDTIITKISQIKVDSDQKGHITPYYLIKFQTPKHWYFYGQNNIIVNQSAFTNWNAGGNNNIGVLGNINYYLNYKNRRHYFENIVKLGYGFVASTGQSTRKTEDYINIAANYGYDIKRNYFLSAGIQFLSQFTTGYNYAVTTNPSYNDRISKFMAPAYVNIGLGFAYNPEEDFQIVFRPINGKFTIVTDYFLQQKDKFGLTRNGQSVRAEIGANFNILYRLKIFKDMDFVNQLNLFSNYLYHPERVDIAYSGRLKIKFNKNIATVVDLDLVYDHDQIQKLQLRETLGIGFIYNLGFENKESDTKKKVITPFILR